MFKEMRRSDRLLSEEETIQILEQGEYGILGTYGEDGYPYAVPLSYAYQDDTIYFHAAGGTGHKLANLQHCDKVSFTVVCDTEVLPEQFSTRYRSAIVFGTACEVAEKEEKMNAFMLLTEKYCPDYMGKGQKYAQAAMDKTAVYAISMDHVTGKGRKN